MPTNQLRCESCGAEQTLEEYVAVGPNTPAARQLNLDEPTQNDHHVVCDDCFERATNEIQSENTRGEAV
jgi:hypothetical protein